jgi:NAD-dependent deacetylase
LIEIGASDQVFILTGAGVSAESGIPTFRDSNGLWRGFRPEDVATPEAWQRDPKLVWDFYSARRRQAESCKPNPGHIALAELERQLGERFLLCTQNVDNLHEKAGSRNVIHMHGELFKSRCDRERCGRGAFEDAGCYDNGAGIPRCDCGGGIRPHICWFGEMPYRLDEVFAALERCNVFITVGSSGLVEPAASFILWAGKKARKRARRFYVGAEEPANSVFFDRRFIGKAGELLPELLRCADVRSR